VSRDGSLFAFGTSKRGQLGLGPDALQAHVPQQVPLPTGVQQVSAGWGHAAALLSDGTLYSWGWAAGGRLGHSFAATGKLAADSVCCMPVSTCPAVPKSKVQATPFPRGITSCCLSHWLPRIPACSQTPAVSTIEVEGTIMRQHFTFHRALPPLQTQTRRSSGCTSGGAGSLAGWSCWTVCASDRQAGTLPSLSVHPAGGCRAPDLACCSGSCCCWCLLLLLRLQSLQSVLGFHCHIATIAERVNTSAFLLNCPNAAGCVWF
jgi:hypothetical protein